MEIVSVDLVFTPPSEGGKECLPTGDGYSPHACTMNGQEYLPVRLSEIPDTSAHGETVRAVMELMYPNRLDYDPILTGEEFRLLEGDRVVATARTLN